MRIRCELRCAPPLREVRVPAGRARLMLKCLFYFGLVTQFIVPAAHASLDDELSKLVRRHLLKVAEKEIPVEVQDPPFKGTVSVVKPEKHLKVKIVDFSIAKDTVTFSADVTGRIKLAGKLGDDEKATDVSAEMEVTLSCDIKFKLFSEDEKIFGKGSVEELSMGFKVLKLTPQDLAGGSDLMTILLNTAFRAKKNKIIEDLNTKYEKVEIKI